MKRTALLILLLAPIALAGCQTIKAHNPFRHKEPQYKSAQQEKPLEVPPGMDKPPTTEALVVPAAGSSTTANAPENVAPPAAQIPAEKTAGGTAATTSTLDLSDTPDSAYRRVGLALERGEVGKVTAHDDTAHTYQVAVDTTVTKKSQGGFFHRLFHHDKTKTVTGTVTLSIAAQGSGSVVEATGNPDATAKVMAILKRRLK
ncbi:MAG: hypothetical protein ACREPY_01640 [Rhodanobacteraceae bacterium]